MPTKSTIEKARRDARKGKSPSTQAGEFVHEEIEHVRQGKHGARSAKQAIAIGLSKARRAGVKLPPPAKGTAGEATRRKAKGDSETGQAGRKRAAPSSLRRSRAATKALKRSGSAAASPRALSRQARAASTRRTRRSAEPRSGKRPPAHRKARSKA